MKEWTPNCRYGVYAIGIKATKPGGTALDSFMAARESLLTVAGSFLIAISDRPLLSLYYPIRLLL